MKRSKKAKTVKRVRKVSKVGRAKPVVAMKRVDTGAAAHARAYDTGMKKIIFAAFVVLVVVALLLVLRSERTTQDQGPQSQEAAQTGAAETQAQAEAPAATAEPAAVPAAEPAPAPAPARVTMNEDVYFEDLQFTAFPTVKELELESGMKYSVSFDLDQSIQFLVYAENRYNEWIASGRHTISKATTKSGPECCANSGSFNIDINNGEGGAYFLVFDDSNMGEYEPRPTKGHVRVVKTSNI